MRGLVLDMDFDVSFVMHCGRGWDGIGLGLSLYILDFLGQGGR